MKKNYLLPLLLLLSIFLFSSCSDTDDDQGGNSNEKKKLLEKLICTDADSSFEMRYYSDSQGRLVKTENDNDDDPTYRTVFEYNSENNPIKAIKYYNVNDTRLTTYDYVKDSIFVKEYEANSQTKIHSIDTLVVDIKGYLKKVHRSDGDFIRYSTYAYDDRGQLTECSYYQRSVSYEHKSQETISYDKKKSHILHLNAKPWFICYVLDMYSNISNPTMIVEKDDNKILETGKIFTSTSKTEYTYTYDEDGYPITLSEKYIRIDQLGEEHVDVDNYKLVYTEIK